LLGRHRDRILARVDAIVAERERLARELRVLPDMWVFPSLGNFVLVRHGRPGDGRATALWEDLYRRGILIRSFDRPGPLSGCLRITVGTPDENTQLLDAMRAAITLP
jgi:histidinol-phosphate aminotransferase